VIFDRFARPVLILHAVVGFTAVFAVTHHAVYAVLSAAGRPNLRALRRFGWIAPASLVAQVVIGLSLYPTYRLRVRAADFDRSAPVFSALFDLKEHLVALSLALVIVAALAGRTRDLPTLDARRAIAALSCVGAVFVWTAALVGLCVTARHAL
jgi:cytochrome bd-type quinol oxidase subunit 2